MTQNLEDAKLVLIISFKVNGNDNTDARLSTDQKQLFNDFNCSM